MSVIFILIACSLLLAGGFLGAFLWASKSGQFDDDYTPSIRMLFEDDPVADQTVPREGKSEKTVLK
ncbi:MAG: cbb3-type cytochrome oxidase assembly protein CcoS [Cyclobacteriaceae bacterium]